MMQDCYDVEMQDCYDARCKSRRTQVEANEDSVFYNF